MLTGRSLLSLVAISVLLLPISAFARNSKEEPTSTPALRDYVFACMNIWNQSKEVKVTAASEREARELIKKNPDNTDFRQTYCAFRRSMPHKPKPKAEEDGDNPTE